MNQPPQKPLPVLDNLSRPFWEGANRGELLLQRCRDCGTYTFYPRYGCNQCLSTSLEWTRASGRGVVYSFTVTRVAPPGFKGDAPYVLGSVELEEGVRMLSRIVDIAPEEIQIGMRVRETFQDVAEGVKLPYFRPE